MSARHRRLVHRIPHRHLDACVPEALLEFAEWHSGLGAMYRVGVAVIVDGVVVDTGQAARVLLIVIDRLNGHLHVSQIGISTVDPVRHEKSRFCERLPKSCPHRTPIMRMAWPFG